jgi:transcription antitermination factor NusG
MKVSIAILETLVSQKLVIPMEHGWKRLLSSDRCVLSHDAASSNGLVLWKALNPSEDGEALPRNDFADFQADCGYDLTAAPDAAPASPWFAVYTTCRHEKRVSQHMAQREIEHFLPVYADQRKWRDGSKVTLELPLFPCYLFVRINRNDRSRVLSVPSVLTIVGGTGREPAPLPDAAIEALQRGVAQRTVSPHPLLTAGQHVRIRSGAFAGMTGIVARRKGGFRVVLTLQQIMQSVAVEVGEQDVELIDSTTSMHSRESNLRLQFA